MLNTECERRLVLGTWWNRSTAGRSSVNASGSSWSDRSNCSCDFRSAACLLGISDARRRRLVHPVPGHACRWSAKIVHIDLCIAAYSCDTSISAVDIR
jgi:hypothetical protein